MAHIGLVEDNDTIVELFTTTFTLAGYMVSTYARGAAFLETCIAGPIPDLSIIDLNLPDIAGIDVIAMLRQAHAGLPVIAISACPFEIARVSARFPAIPTFCKLCSLATLLQTIRFLEAGAGQVKAV
ncbi:MAG: response regulator transcription factor [Ktedonobacteraceae bacterium]